MSELKRKMKTFAAKQSLTDKVKGHHDYHLSVRDFHAREYPKHPVNTIQRDNHFKAMMHHDDEVTKYLKAYHKMTGKSMLASVKPTKESTSALFKRYGIKKNHNEAKRVVHQGVVPQHKIKEIVDHFKQKSFNIYTVGLHTHMNNGHMTEGLKLTPYRDHLEPVSQTSYKVQHTKIKHS